MRLLEINKTELDRVIASKMSEIDNDHSATIEEKMKLKPKLMKLQSKHD